MTKLWYEIKKRLGNIEIEKHCDLCRENLEELDKHPLKEEEVIIIYPSFNCSGVLTQVHIGRALRKNVQETKIYKNLEK